MISDATARGYSVVRHDATGLLSLAVTHALLQFLHAPLGDPFLRP
jgi:hypothetical protein